MCTRGVAAACTVSRPRGDLWPSLAQAQQRVQGWLMGSSTPKEGAGGGSCMWGFVGAASFAAVRGLWGLVLGSDEDARFAVDMQRRMEIRSAEDAFSNQSGVARRCWSACIEPAAGPSQPAGVMPVRSRSNLPGTEGGRLCSLRYEYLKLLVSVCRRESVPKRSVASRTAPPR